MLIYTYCLIGCNLLSLPLLLASLGKRAARENEFISFLGAMIIRTVSKDYMPSPRNLSNYKEKGFPGVKL